MGAVAELFELIVRSGSREPPPGLAKYFERSLLDHPWYDPEIPSLVYVDEGQIAGFLASYVRRFRFEGRPVRLACSAHLITDPKVRAKAAGAFLMKQFLAGPQEATFTDTASDEMRRIWEGLGGVRSHLACIGWVRIFRPARFAFAYRSRHRVGSASQPMTRPASVVSRIRRPRAGSVVVAEPLSPQVLVQHLPAVTGSLRLYPNYDDEFLDFLFRDMEGARTRGMLVRTLVRDATGDVLGWYVYYLRPGGISQVQQIAAPQRHVEAVLDHLFDDARSKGAAALQGRVEPLLLDSLSRRRCLLHYSGYLALVHARDSELLYAIASGQALMTRMEGEWWMSADSEPFTDG
jgi:hypothetical protein